MWAEGIRTLVVNCLPGGGMNSYVSDLDGDQIIVMQGQNILFAIYCNKRPWK